MSYLQMGVGAVWVVNPLRRSAYAVERRGWVAAGELTVPGTDIGISTAAVFSELDALQARKAANM